MNTFTVLIREVVTTDRRVTVQAHSEEEALIEVTSMAASGVYSHGRRTSRTESAFPLLSTLERTDEVN